MTSNIVSALILTGLLGFVIAGVFEYVMPRGEPTGSDEGLDLNYLFAKRSQYCPAATGGPDATERSQF
jgi:hypothetical protein